MSRLEQIINCMESRLGWYKKSIAMACGDIPWENGYNWPSSTNHVATDPTSIMEWRGAVRELQNSIDMLRTC